MTKKQRPREPQQRKGESWADYCKRHEQWREQVGPRGWTPEQGERWQQSRDRILAAAKRNVDEYIERLDRATRNVPYMGRPKPAL